MRGLLEFHIFRKPMFWDCKNWQYLSLLSGRNEVCVIDKLVCPICLSGYIATERRPDGFNICVCGYKWKNKKVVADSKYELLEKENRTLDAKNDEFRALLLKCSELVRKIYAMGLSHYDTCEYDDCDESTCSCGSAAMEIELFNIIKEIKNL